MISRLFLLAGIGLLGLSSGCSEAEGPPFIRTPASSDLQTFKKYVNLAEEPKAVTFETFYRVKPSATPGPSDWWLMAVLTYDPATLKRVKDKSHVSRDAVILNAGEIRSWFPRAIKNALINSGDESAKLSGPAYQANIFRKAPLNSGLFAVPADSAYLLLQMDCCGPVTSQPPSN